MLIGGLSDRAVEAGDEVDAVVRSGNGGGEVACTPLHDRGEIPLDRLRVGSPLELARLDLVDPVEHGDG